MYYLSLKFQLFIGDPPNKSPIKASEIQQLENLQRWYSKIIPAISNLNYWQRLRALNMLSQQRRMERYRIIYTWMILEGLVPNCGLEEIQTGRRRRELKVPPLKGKQAIRSIREQSFQVKGPQLFNSLPKNIKNITKVSVEEFKAHLDKYIENVPDEPSVDGLTLPQQPAIPSQQHIQTLFWTNQELSKGNLGPEKWGW